MRSGSLFNFLTTSLIAAGRLSHLISVVLCCLVFVSWGQAERGDQPQCWWSKRCTSDDVPHRRDLSCKSHCSRSESHFTSVSSNNINCGISFAAACEPHNIWAGPKEVSPHPQPFRKCSYTLYRVSLKSKTFLKPSDLAPTPSIHEESETLKHCRP